MPRIRSVHPSLFTDEAFVQLTSDAQIFLIGLGTEADDQGIFEWKPVTLRMRLRPTRDGDVEPLLAEMMTVDLIRSYEIDGRRYGAIRNFRKHQKPKSPNSVHPITPEIGKYVRLPRSSSENAEDEREEIPTNGKTGEAEQGQFPQNGEINVQMEDGKKERTKAKALDAGGVLPFPAPSQSASPPIPDQGVWGKPLQYLITKSSKSEKDCRSLLGKWRKANTDEAIIAAFTRAQVEDVLEPVAFLTALLAGKAKAEQFAERKNRLGFGDV